MLAASEQGSPSRWKALALAIAFIATSLAAKLILWWALSFLGEKSIVKSTVAGLVALAAAVPRSSGGSGTPLGTSMRHRPPLVCDMRGLATSAVLHKLLE